jgi:hypothetical protein
MPGATGKPDAPQSQIFAAVVTGMYLVTPQAAGLEDKSMSSPAAVSVPRQPGNTVPR